MADPAKVKLSITVSRELVERIDAEAHRGDSTRSAVIERWLRRAARAHAEHLDPAS